MSESPKKLINIDTPSEKENVEISAGVNVEESDQKDDSPTDETIPNLESGQASEISNIHSEETPNIQSPESGLESSVEVSDNSKSECLIDSTPETESQNIFDSIPVSSEKQPITSLDSDVSPLSAQDSNATIDKECASSVVIPSTEQSLIRSDSEVVSSALASTAFEVSNEDCSSVAEENVTAIDPEVSQSSNSSSIVNVEETGTSSNAKDEESLALPTSPSVASNMECSIPSSISELPLTELHKEMSPSLTLISLEPPNLGDSAPVTSLSEQQSTELNQETSTVPSIPSEITSQERTIPSIIISEEPPEELEKEIPLTPSSTTAIANTEDTVLSMEQPTEPEIQVSSPEASSTESSNQSTVPPEQLTGLQAEIPVSVPSTSQAANEECSSILSTDISEAAPPAASTSGITADVSSSEEHTEVIAQRLRKQLTTMKTALNGLKETETLLDNGYRRCLCNSKKTYTIAKSPGCKQCPGSATMHLYAQDARFTISQLFVHLQRIYNWFKCFENIDDNFKVHMIEIENLQKEVSDMLKRFNLGHW